jgi:predicted transcriptional regulator
MEPASALRTARRRARLTQRELAARASVAQPTVARIESGKEDPRMSTLQRLLAECGDELRQGSRRGVGVDRSLIRELLRQSPAQRVDQLRSESQAFAALSRARRAPDAV